LFFFFQGLFTVRIRASGGMLWLYGKKSEGGIASDLETKNIGWINKGISKEKDICSYILTLTQAKRLQKSIWNENQKDDDTNK
jgi:hypothetical protein